MTGRSHQVRFDEPVRLEPGVAGYDDLRAAIKGTVLAKARLVGRYASTSDAG